MLFNSISFAIFLPVVFFLYWFAANKNIRAQNILLLVASYFFYASWDWRFLFLLVFSTLLDYGTAIKMAESQEIRWKNFWLSLSITINIGLLGVFKYFNFFTESFVAATSHFGWKLDPWTIHVILPLGISFYTFHGLSYVLDNYKNRIKPERDLVNYSLFVNFFPLLIAGPIERATHLLPQIQQKRTFDYLKATEGLRQLLWGLFKKIVIADQCAIYANMIFNNYSNYSGSTLLLGAVFFTFQIYADFSGYSDIAIGTAKLFGIDLLRNFAYPYFSRDIAEYWRRWHISLSSWFRDYLYIPLGGSRGSTWMRIRNVFIIFIISGFWHGANWTFIIWGLLNALFIMPLIIFRTNRLNLDIVAGGKMLPTVRELLSMILTFTLTVFTWIFFRAEHLHQALHYIINIFNKSLFLTPKVFPIKIIILVFLFMLIEWFGREQQFAIARIDLKIPTIIRWGFYYFLAIIIFYFAGPQQPFIYFQF
jgi:alginate O-acetyltransferase complex protein AlgI